MQGIKATISTIIGATLPKTMFVFAALGAVLMTLSGPAMASDGASKKGRETGLPIPRFVSLKAKAVNLRVGPGKKYAIEWHYKKRGLPVEVIQEFDRWRRVRDADGATGWVLHSLLSAKRTAVIAPWDHHVANLSG